MWLWLRLCLIICRALELGWQSFPKLRQRRCGFIFFNLEPPPWRRVETWMSHFLVDWIIPSKYWYCNSLNLMWSVLYDRCLKLKENPGLKNEQKNMRFYCAGCPPDYSYLIYFFINRLSIAGCFLLITSIPPSLHFYKLYPNNIHKQNCTHLFYCESKIM